MGAKNNLLYQSKFTKINPSGKVLVCGETTLLVFYVIAYLNIRHCKTKMCFYQRLHLKVSTFFFHKTISTYIKETTTGKYYDISNIFYLEERDFRSVSIRLSRSEALIFISGRSAESNFLALNSCMSGKSSSIFFT